MQKEGERDIPPLKKEGNRLFLDAIIRVPMDQHKAYILEEDPSLAKGSLLIEVKNSRGADVFKPPYPYMFVGESSEPNSVTADSIDLIVRDSKIAFWNAKPAENCPTRETGRIPAGVYTTMPYRMNMQIPYVKDPILGKWSALFLKTKIKAAPQKLRITHACPGDVGQLAQKGSQFVDKFRTRNAKNLKSPENAKNQPVAVGMYNLSGPVQLKGEFYAIPGQITQGALLSEVVKSPEEQGRKRRFLAPPKNSGGNPIGGFDSERKLLEDLAHKLGIKYEDGANCGTFTDNKQVKGTITLFVDKETCIYCAELAWQLRDMLPNVTITWIDEPSKNKYTCY